MSEKSILLATGLTFSLVIHLGLFQALYTMSHRTEKRRYETSYLIPVQTPPKAPEVAVPEKKPVPVPEKPIRVTRKTVVAQKPVPLRASPQEPAGKTEDVKPVFGVSAETVIPDNASGAGVRIGNTLMKAQEEAYTPPEKVKPYTLVPDYELSTLPAVTRKVKPEYPPQLEEEEREGETILTVTIDEKGAVVDVTVKFSDHELFSAAAMEAMKRFVFKPATLDGAPVATTIDYTMVFLLD